MEVTWSIEQLVNPLPTIPAMVLTPTPAYHPTVFKDEALEQLAPLVAHRRPRFSLRRVLAEARRLPTILQLSNTFNIEKIKTIATEEDKVSTHHSRVSNFNRSNLHLYWKQSIRHYRPFEHRDGSYFYRIQHLKSQPHPLLDIFGATPNVPNSIDRIIKMYRTILFPDKLLYSIISMVAIRAWTFINNRYLDYHPSDTYESHHPVSLVMLYHKRDLVVQSLRLTKKNELLCDCVHPTTFTLHEGDTTCACQLPRSESISSSSSSSNNNDPSNTSKPLTQLAKETTATDFAFYTILRVLRYMNPKGGPVYVGPSSSSPSTTTTKQDTVCWTFYNLCCKGFTTWFDRCRYNVHLVKNLDKLVTKHLQENLSNTSVVSEGKKLIGPRTKRLYTGKQVFHYEGKSESTDPAYSDRLLPTFYSHAFINDPYTPTIRPGEHEQVDRFLWDIYLISSKTEQKGIRKWTKKGTEARNKKSPLNKEEVTVVNDLLSPVNFRYLYMEMDPLTLVGPLSGYHKDLAIRYPPHSLLFNEASSIHWSCHYINWCVGRYPDSKDSSSGVTLDRLRPQSWLCSSTEEGESSLKLGNELWSEAIPLTDPVSLDLFTLFTKKSTMDCKGTGIIRSQYFPLHLLPFVCDSQKHSITTGDQITNKAILTEVLSASQETFAWWLVHEWFSPYIYNHEQIRELHRSHWMDWWDKEHKYTQEHCEGWPFRDLTREFELKLQDVDRDPKEDNEVVDLMRIYKDTIQMNSPIVDNCIREFLEEFQREMCQKPSLDNPYHPILKGMITTGVVTELDRKQLYLVSSSNTLLVLRLLGSLYQKLWRPLSYKMIGRMGWTPHIKVESSTGLVSWSKATKKPDLLSGKIGEVVSTIQETVQRHYTQLIPLLSSSSVDVSEPASLAYISLMKTILQDKRRNPNSLFNEVLSACDQALSRGIQSSLSSPSSASNSSIHKSVAWLRATRDILDVIGSGRYKFLPAELLVRAWEGLRNESEPEQLLSLLSSSSSSSSSYSSAMASIISPADKLALLLAEIPKILTYLPTVDIIKNHYTTYPLADIAASIRRKFKY